MADMQVGVKFKKQVEFTKGFDHCAAYLKDLPAQVTKNFPGVRILTEIEPGVLQWEFDRIEVKGMSLDIVCVTSVSASLKQISVKPIPGRGTAALTATWVLSENSSKMGCLDFQADISLDLNIPLWLRPIALPFAQSELAKLFDRYLTHVQKNI